MSDINFRPVRGKAEAIKNLAYTDGYVYFATDTGKIYLDANDKRVAMGGNSGIFYGNMTPPEGADTDQVDFSFYFNEIDGDQIPNPDDLILNIPDGCFYRVENVIEEEEIVETTKLTIAGSGAGPGGGGGTSRITIKDIDNTLTKYYTTDVESAKLRFSVTSNITEDNFITSMTYTVGNIDTVLDTEPKDFGILEFDLTKYIPKMSTTVSTTVKITVEDNYGTVKSISYRINVIELTLASSITDAILYTSSKSYDYFCTPRGGTNLQNRKLIFTIYDELGNPYGNIQEVSVTSTNEVKKTLDFSESAHGVYDFTVQYVGDTSDGLRIESNLLKYRLINYDTEVNTTLLTVVQPAKTVEQYSVLEISYMIGGDPQSATGESTVILTLNGNEVEQVVKNNIAQTWRLFFDTVGTYDLSIAVGSNEIVLDPITVTKYQGNMPTINEDDENLLLLLKTTNRSNNEINRDIWSYKNATAQLNDFYWGEINGWMVDDKNESMLRLTAGANLEVENCYPFANDAKTSGLTIELDFKISGVLDFSKPLIKCLSHNQEIIQTGFQITGQESTMNSMEIKATGGEIREGDSAEDQVYNTAIQGLTAKFTEDERIHLTWVIERYDSTSSSKPLVRTYLNGIMSGLTQYNSSDRFQDNPADPATIIIDSTYADIDIYNIRIYSIALDQTAVLNNYIATSGTVDDRVAIAADNDIVYEDGKINPEKVFHEEYMLSIPYLKLVGGTSLNKDDKWALTNETDENGNLIYRLPEAKKDYRLMSVEFVDPTGQRENWKEGIQLKNPSTGEIVYDAKDAEAGFRVEEGCQVYGQGTSSMEYPVKNLRIKSKQHKVILYKGAYPVDLVCCKADFMESSSSHNTGTANLVDELYKKIGIKTPAQEFYNADNWGYDIVTAIKGFPVAIFWSPDGEDFEYIGKYNFNMDKATHEPFGFVNYPEEYDPSATSTFGWTSEGKNAIHCFEFLNNASPLDNFLPETGKAYVPVALLEEDYEPNKYYTLKADEKTIETAFILSAAEAFDSNTQYYQLFEDGGFESTFYKMVYSDGEWVPNWFTCYESRYPEFDTPEETEIDAWYRLCSWIASFGVDEDGKIYDNKVTQFKTEFPNYFNEDFTIFYYVLTHFLLMIDSRAKNMMMATWDNIHWYPIFYDMDTMLGLNNYGYNKFNYTAIDTEANLYNSQNSVLWKYVRAAFSTEIAAMYNRLRSSGNLNYGTLINRYNTTQADAWNEALYNADIYYKYIRPFSEGYYNSVTGDKIWVEPGEKNYLYAAQGRRSMHRQWWLNNRFNFFDGMYLSDQYKQDYFGMRLYTPSATDKYERDTTVTAENYEAGKYYVYDAETESYIISNDPFDEETAYYVEGSGIGVSASVVPPNSDFHLTPLQDQYLSVAYGGENGQTIGPVYTKANTTQIIKAAQTAFIDTETYVYGGSMLKDLGDLSPQYLGKFVFPNKVTKLEKLIIGNPHNDYYNPNFSELSIGSKAPYLEELNIMNCKGLRGRSVDISQCRRIKQVLATGSGVSNIVLPEYGILEELRLPETTTSVSLVDHENLNDENFTVGTCNYNPETKVYTYTNDFSNIQTLQIENTPINGYNIVMGSNKLLFVTLKGFNWTVTENSLNGIQLETIDVLDKIATKTPVDGTTTLAASISGNIHVAVPGAKVNAIDIYNKYWEKFPNVTFTYDEEVMDVTKALTITFLDGSNEPYWSKKIAEGDYVTEEFLSTGPDGSFKEPTKAPSASHTFTFSGNWTGDDGLVWSTENIKNSLVFGAVEKDWTFTPIFNSIIKTFEVSFTFGKINSSNGLVETITNTENYDYGSYVNFPTIIPYKDDSELIETETYMFKGWSLDNSKDIATSDAELAQMIVNPVNYVVAKKLSFTPVFMKVNIKDAVVSEEYFITSRASYTDINGVLYNGITIGLNKIYTLQGKITLPAKIGEDTVIGISADGFKDQHLITHIFWEDGTFVKKLGTNSFSNMSKLRYFETPAGLETIDSFAFYYSRKLKPSIIAGPKLVNIKESAFNTVCEKTTDRLFIKIGGSVQTLGTRAFGYNSHGYRTIQIGDLGEPSQLSSIGENAFILDTTYGLEYDEIIIYTDDVGKDIWDNNAFAVAKNKQILNA